MGLNFLAAIVLVAGELVIPLASAETVTLFDGAPVPTAPSVTSGANVQWRTPAGSGDFKAHFTVYGSASRAGSAGATVPGKFIRICYLYGQGGCAGPAELYTTTAGVHMALIPGQWDLTVSRHTVLSFWVGPQDPTTTVLDANDVIRIYVTY